MDSFRFYLAKDPFGGDINFNEEALLAVHNNELADVLVRERGRGFTGVLFVLSPPSE